MSYFRIPSGSELVLHVQLSDGNTGKYVRSHVFDADTMLEIPTSPFVLGHVALGLYANLSVSVPDGRYVAVSIVYDDPGYTTPSSRYGRSTDIFDVNDIVNVNAISEGVWRETLAGNAPAGSFGEAVSVIGTKVADAPTVKTNTDTLVARLTAPRAALLDNLVDLDTPVSGVPGEVWEQNRAAHSGAGTFGEALDVPVSTRQSEALADSRFGTLIDEHNATQVSLAGVASNVNSIKDQTDQLAFSGGLVQAETVTNSDKGDVSLSAAGLLAVADAVWDEALSGHSTAGSAGERLSTAATGTNPALVAAAVWNEPKATHNNVGTFGESNQGVVSVARAAALDNLDAAISSRESESSAASRSAANSVNHATTQGAIDALDLKVGTPSGASIANDIIGIKVDTVDIKNRLGSPVGASFSADIAAIKADTAPILADTGTIKSRLGYGGGGSVEASFTAQNAVVASIKTKTDQLGFSGGNVLARAVLVDDKVGYSLHASSVATVADAVWDETAASHVAAGSTGEKLTQAAAGTSPAAVADAVWDEAIAGHSGAGSVGALLLSTKTVVDGVQTTLADGTNGLAAIRTTVLNEGISTRAEVNANEVKIDAIVPAVTASQAAVIAEVNANEAKIDAIVPAISASQVAVIAEVNQNEAKIDAIQGTVGSIQNNTTARFIVPERLIKPTLGSKTYQFHLRLYDSAGNPEAPDSAPTIRIRRLDTGIDVVVGAAMTQDGAKVGAYYYDYVVTAGSFLAPVLVEATVVEGGVTRYLPSTSEVTEFEGDLAQVQATLNTVEGKVDGITADVQSGTHGLAAIKAGQTDIISEVSANEVKIDAVKAVVDAIPTNPSTSAEVAGVLAAVNTKPDLASITTVVNTARDNIKGTGGHTITNVIDQQATEFSAVAKTSDPRFANLDATVSSRGTLTAPQVWSHATRELTAVPGLDNADVKSIWDYQAGFATVVGSIGKQVVDNLDAKVSTRATAAQVTAALAGVAQETTLNAVQSSLSSEINANETKIDGVRAVVDTISAKTNNLPSDPASQTALSGAISVVDGKVSSSLVYTQAIKAKTDNLPADPAREATVTARPTNPLLASDPRLNNLANCDAPVSGITTPDVSLLATKSDVQNEHIATRAAVSVVNASVGSNISISNTIKTKTDGLPANIATTTDVTASRDAVLNNLNARGPELTAAQVWAYSTREITQDPMTFGPDISGLAEKTDLSAVAPHQYNFKMSTVRNPANGEQEIITWAEKDGVVATGSDCTVSVKDALGVLVWDATLASPNADGVFRFANPLSVPKSQNYYITITMTVDGQPRTSRSPFYTVV